MGRSRPGSPTSIGRAPWSTASTPTCRRCPSARCSPRRSRRSGRCSGGPGRAMTSEVAGQVDLRPALFRLDLRLRLAVANFREVLAERARDPLRGLYITEADVDDLLDGVAPAEQARRLLAGPAAEATPRLRRLASLFGLDPFEQEALLVCLAPDLDLRYERLYGYLQDDATRRRPTVDLILRLLCPDSLEERLAARAAPGPDSRLLRKGLLSLVSADDGAPGPLP